MSEARWLDFSGAPVIVISRDLAASWRGTTDPSTGEYRGFDPDDPVTDYDRACLAAWSGSGIVEVSGQQVLCLEAELDLISWDGCRWLVGCGGLWLSDDQLDGECWVEAVRWHTDHSSLILMNPTVDGRGGLNDVDFLPMNLSPGSYSVATCRVGLSYFHRFVRSAV